MAERRLYEIRTDGKRWESNLTEEDVEALYKHYHGFVSIKPLEPQVAVEEDTWVGFEFDFEEIAAELGEEAQ